MLFSEADLLPLSGIQHMAFCPRRAALIHMEGVWEENMMTAEGRIFHERVHKVGHESRGEIRIAFSLPCRSLRLGLSGKLDVVEFRKIKDPIDELDTKRGAVLGDVDGWWAPFPIEYKRGKKKHELSFEIQLCAQTICLEEMLHVEIPSGAIYYGKSARRQEVIFTSGLHEKTEDIALRYHELIASGQTPLPSYSKKCSFCSLFDKCMPKVTGSKKNVCHYIKRALTETEEN
ncbi:MAG TPA: CRISPR-associated protein Cas4 [Thermoanaerobaculia bacterium]|nr:CRISPR-associated protein Cas4 [Thermoanaerobaculia bacterium]